MAPECKAQGCTRRTKRPLGFCWQHADMSATDPPKCKLCQKIHWQRVGCDGKLQERVVRLVPAPQGETKDITVSRDRLVKRAKKKARKKK